MFKLIEIVNYLTLLKYNDIEQNEKTRVLINFISIVQQIESLILSVRMDFVKKFEVEIFTDIFFQGPLNPKK